MFYVYVKCSYHGLYLYICFIVYEDFSTLKFKLKISISFNVSL